MKVLITTLGSTGDLNPVMGIGLELKKQGHYVGIATSMYFKTEIEKQGLAFHEVFPNLDPGLEDLKKFVTDPIKGSELLHRHYIFPGLEKSYETVLGILDDYDMVLSATLTYFTPIACRIKNKPWITVCLSPMLFFSAYDPPVLAPLPQLRHFYFSPSVNKFLFNLLFRMSSSWLEPYHRLWKKVGLEGTPNPFLKDGFSPYGTLALFSPIFGKPQPDWTNNVFTAGFSFYDKNSNSTRNDDLTSFLAENPSPVLFTLGTTAVMNPGKMYDEFIEAQNRLGFPCIILTGKENYGVYKKYHKGNVFIADFISYSVVMPDCSLIVHQGGSGTTAQAMRSGNPMIILPHCNDQYDNAQRAENLGVSKTLPYKSLSVNKLEKLVDQVLNSSEMKMKAIELGRIIRTEQAEQNAVKFIEEVFSGQKEK